MNQGVGGEARRSARVATRFLVAVEGVDPAMISRAGDISATGIYFQTDVSLGEPGNVHALRVASANLAHEIRLLAHVVRTVKLAPQGRTQRFGVALEFMPESEEAALDVERFVQYVLLVVDEPSEASVSPRLSVLPRDEMRPEMRAEGSGMIRQLSVRSMTLEANWSVVLGEHIGVEIVAPGRSRRVRLEGSAVRITPMGPADTASGYEIEVEFRSEVERPPGYASTTTLAAVRPDARLPAKAATPLRVDDDVSNVLDDLFSALIHPPEDSRPKREHLSGLLSRIRLPTLCALFDMERLSGELTLRRGEETGVIYVSEGRLIDVEPVKDGVSPRERIGQLLSWDDGSFEFSVVIVDRPDRVRTGTTALLLDLARASDEERERSER